MTLQEMFNKAQEHFAQMGQPSIVVLNCAQRGQEDNKCIVGAFIDDDHYHHTFEGKSVLEFSTLGKTCGVQPVLNAVAASMGVDALDDEQANLLFQLQLIHDDHSDLFDVGVDNWYTLVEAHLIDLALKSGLEHNLG